MLPTEELYRSLEIAYTHFNNALFDGKLPPVIFTVQRQKGVMGYFIPDRWGSLKGDKCHEIAINPSYIAQSRMIEIFQTLVHEMAHCWQHCFGNPGRSYYHNKEWAYKMIKLGLMPTSTGELGGAITGQHMSDYVIKDGLFLNAYEQLFKEKKFKLAWVDRKALPRLNQPNIISIEGISNPDMEHVNNTVKVTDSDECVSALTTSVMMGADSFLEDKIHTSTFADLMPHDFVEAIAVKKKVKIRYNCPVCNTNLWGKPNIRIRCEDCNILYNCES